MRHRILALAASLPAACTAMAAAADATLPAQRLGYASAFSGLPPATDPAPIDWWRSNALVGTLQGHAGHLRAGPDKPQDAARRNSPATAAGADKP